MKIVTEIAKRLKAGAPKGHVRGVTAVKLASLLIACVGLASCGISKSNNSTGGRIQIVAAENFWGSIAAQLGGSRVRVTSIITNPTTDPHSYEPKPADARLVASARYTIINGAGYDPWAQKLLNANSTGGRDVLNIGDLAGRHGGDNPHMWYSPSIVGQVIDRITHDLERIDPKKRNFFEAQRRHFLNVGLRTYHSLIRLIGQRYHGTPVGATESIFIDLARALRLQLITPPDFMKTISEGQEPTAADKATFDAQISQRKIRVFVYNRQNATTDTDALKQKAQAAGIPVVPITETLDPPQLTFQAWQVTQFRALERALARPRKY